MLREVGRGIRPGDIAIRHTEHDVIVLKKRCRRRRHEFRFVNSRVGHRRLCGLREDQCNSNKKLHGSILVGARSVSGLPVGTTRNATARTGASAFAEPNDV